LAGGLLPSPRHGSVPLFYWTCSQLVSAEEEEQQPQTPQPEPETESDFKPKQSLLPLIPQRKKRMRSKSCSASVVADWPMRTSMSTRSLREPQTRRDDNLQRSISQRPAKWDGMNVHAGSTVAGSPEMNYSRVKKLKFDEIIYEIGSAPGSPSPSPSTSPSSPDSHPQLLSSSAVSFSAPSSFLSAIHGPDSPSPILASPLTRSMESICELDNDPSPSLPEIREPATAKGPLSSQSFNQHGLKSGEPLPAPPVRQQSISLLPLPSVLLSSKRPRSTPPSPRTAY